MTKKQSPYSFGSGLLRAVPPPEPTQEPAPVPEPKSARAPSRAGKRAVTFYVPEEAWAQLRTFTIREPGASVQSLMAEALNDLFSKRGVNRFD